MVPLARTINPINATGRNGRSGTCSGSELRAGEAFPVGFVDQSAQKARWRLRSETQCAIRNPAIAVRSEFSRVQSPQVRTPARANSESRLETPYKILAFRAALPPAGTLSWAQPRRQARNLAAYGRKSPAPGQQLQSSRATGSTPAQDRDAHQRERQNHGGLRPPGRPSCQSRCCQLAASQTRAKRRQGCQQASRRNVGREKSAADIHCEKSVR